MVTRWTPPVMLGLHLAQRVWSYLCGEAATANNTNIRNPPTDSQFGNGVQRLPETGGSERSSATLAGEDGLGADGHRRTTDGAPRKRRTKGRITIASLNMRGYGLTGAAVAEEKWLRINQLMRDKKVAVLGLQETHLTEARLENLNTLFNASMKVLGSLDDQNEAGARGVAFAVNTRIISTEDLKLTEIVPGRAAVLSFRWTGDRIVHVLNVYAPNGGADNASFWESVLDATRERRMRRPEIVLGDFNLVEDSLDRLPTRNDHTGAVESLQRLMAELGLSDGWRRNNPRERAFSYLQNATGSQSRIDRVYASEELMRRAEDWQIEGPGFPTDHRVVSVSLANYKAPAVGKGRWALPLALLQDGEFAKTLRNLGEELQKCIDEMTERTPMTNPQTAYLAFKTKLKDAARKRAKALLSKLDRRIAAMEVDIKQLLEAENPDEQRVAVLQDALAKLEIKRFDRKRRAVATKDWLQGETMTRYWTKLNAPQLPSTIIYELCVSNDATDPRRRTYSSSSPIMAETAKKHYDALQADPDIINVDHERAMDEALEPLDSKLTSQQKGIMARRIRRCEVVAAIDESPLGKAPGLDGIPAELWKTLLKWERAEEESGRRTLRISSVIQAVFNDIEAHGVEAADFTKGWICPIYKLKKDQREIVNYRPITLLNSDYKILTRVMAVRLANVADSLVHSDQAAFIPGRTIFGHIKLSKSIIEYADAVESNGAIVALDQEKAYDMISHEYLWAVLRKLNFPENFIKTVRNLYEKAESCVMVNGSESTFYRIVRGVRQGDPMSCLLFILAIEPLACALRKSTLKGMEIAGDVEKLVAALFADDTTVYLSESDNFEDLQTILDKWCRAARARFNVEKTDILPVGTPEFRSELAERRSQTTLGESIPASVRIVKDGELIRSLGAWIGNRCDNDVPWMNMIRTVEKNLAFWSRRRPTLNGRKLIIGMEVGGRTQFLAKAHPMSENVEKRLETIVSMFMSNGERRPRVGKDTLYLPISQGGLNLLDVKARNEAIDVIALKEYLLTRQVRPRWAIVVDAIFAAATTAASRNVEETAKLNAFLQTWKISTHRSAGLGEGLRRMVKVATKYNATLAPRNPSNDFKGAMPVWYHVGELDGRSLANTLSAKCLRDRHGVETVADCGSVAERLARRSERTGGHVLNKRCECFDCVRDRTVKGCDDPHRCAAMAAKILAKLGAAWKPVREARCDGLSLTPRRLKKNADARSEEGRITFNPSVRTSVPIETAFRIFGEERSQQNPVWAVRPDESEEPRASVEVFTDGSCEHNGSTKSVAAYGIWFGRQDRRNIGARVPGEVQSNQVAEIVAVEEAAKRVSPWSPMHIVSDSRFVVDGLTTYLPAWEDRGWLGVKCAAYFQRAVAHLRARAAVTTLRWVKGHSGVEGNEGADALAKTGLERDATAMLDISPDLRKFLHDGMRLATVTQSMAYRMIRQRKMHKERPTTATVIARVQATMEADYTVSVTAECIWTRMRDRDIPRKMRDFLWKLAHGAQRVGKYWENISGYEQRATCEVCGVEDSMEHILVECSAPGQRTIWKMAKAALALAGVEELPISIGVVIGAPTISLRDQNGKVRRGPTRLAKILTVEAAHMIWRLRCERVIQWEGEDRLHSEREVRNRFWAAVNRRMLIDKDLVVSRISGRKPKRTAVLETWRDVLAGARELPEDWIEVAGVLVGTLGQAGTNGIG